MANDPHFIKSDLDVQGQMTEGFEVPTVSLRVHNRIEPRTIIESMRTIVSVGPEYGPLEQRRMAHAIEGA